MDHCFQAIYEHGILRPLEPLPLKDAEIVSLTLHPSGGESAEAAPRDKKLAMRQRASLLAFVEKMESLPDNSPEDGLSNRDHDRLIYGS